MIQKENMDINFNEIVTTLLSENKISERSEDYKKVYIDGVLDFYNLMEKAKKNI